jgi:hypothetical protein
LELHFCREALEKKNFFAMSPLGAVAGAGWPNFGEPRRGLAGGGLGKGLGVLRVRFVAGAGWEIAGEQPAWPRSALSGGAPAWERRRGWLGRLRGTARMLVR